MIRLGLSSQAFPARTPREVIDLALKLGLEGIEWTADTHLAVGDRGASQALLYETLRARLAIVSLSALYRVGAGREQGLAFQNLLDTAVALQAPILRIYAGSSLYHKLRDGEKAAVTTELRRLGDLAGTQGVTLSLTLARGTALEDYVSALALFADLKHAFVRLAWESLPGRKSAEATATLATLSPETALVFARGCDKAGAAASLDLEPEAWASRLEAYLAGETAPKMSRFILMGRLGEDDEARLQQDVAFLKPLVALKNPVLKY